MRQLCLYIDGYIYPIIKGQNLLLYNLDTGKSKLFNINYSRTFDVIKEISLPQNAFSTLINEDDLKLSDLAIIVDYLKKSFWGDCIVLEDKQNKPITFVPMCNLDNSRQNTYKDIKCICIAINSKVVTDSKYLMQKQLPVIFESEKYQEMNIDDIIKFLSQLGHDTHIKLIGGDISRHNDIKKLMVFLDRFDYYDIYIDAEYYKKCELSQKHTTIVVKPQCADIQNIYNDIDNKDQYSFLLTVKCEYDLIKARQYKEMMSDININIIPLFDDNYSFFKEYVFTNRNELCQTALSKGRLFANKNINSNYYGELFINPQNEIFTNFNFTDIGKTCDDLSLLLTRASQANQAWYLTREVTPCNNCVFQFLCPPISDYEIVLNKYDLCY